MGAKWADIDRAIRQEWHDMRHNASLLGLRGPEMGDKEAEAFDEWVSDFYAPECMDRIKQDIKQEFGIDWHIGQWGRGGATLAPQELVPGQEYDRGNVATAYQEQHESWYGPGQDALKFYNEDRKTLAALRYLQAEVTAGLSQIFNEWADDKAANGWEF